MLTGLPKIGEKQTWPSIMQLKSVQDLQVDGFANSESTLVALSFFVLTSSIIQLKQLNSYF